MVPFFVQIKCELGRAYAVADALSQSDLAPVFRKRQRIRSSLTKHWFENRGHSFEKRVVARIGGGILRTELRNLAAAQLRVRTHQQASAIRKRRRALGLR